MTDRAKESVFNLLRGWFEGATVLDLFAGVGTMGLEAASRGATTVVMVEKDRGVADCLRRNVETLGCTERVKVVMADALARETLATVPRPVQIIFVDPPYELMEREPSRERVVQQVARCRELMGDSGFVVLRTPLDPAATAQPIEGFDGPEAHRMGAGMWVLLYTPRK